MFQATQLIGFGAKRAAASAAKVVTYQTQNSTNGPQTTYTWTTQAIGTAASDRYVILAVVALNNSAAVPTDAKVNSVSMGTRLVRCQRGGGTVDFYCALVTSGTTAQFDVVFGVAPDRCGIMIWSATGLSSSAAVGTGTNTGATSPYVTGSFSTSNGGFVVGAACDNVGSATWSSQSMTGGGAATFTEDYDGIWGGSPTMMGMHSGSTNGTSCTVSVSQSSSNANGGFAVVSF